ncbi:MAG: Hint domain-containing protein [Pseudobdellovibrionaceae bacterium]|nr:Hint domain-containing protein [Pseudobdellovibrionaceae bacterium]
MKQKMKVGFLMGAISLGALSTVEGFARPPMEEVLDPIDGGGGSGGTSGGIFRPRPNAAYYAAMIPLSLGDLLERCEADNLSSEDAVGRFQWLKTHHRGLIVAYYNKIFGEDGASEDSKIYDVETEWFYLAGNRARPKPRPNYLTFGTPDFQNPANWFAPRLASAGYVSFPSGYITLGICASSCYTPDQKILFAEGEVPIGEALQKFLPEKSLHDVYTLSDGSTLDNIGLQTRKVKNYTKSATETNHQIRMIQTAGGGHLKVTPNHPLLRHDGVMKEAGSLVVGDRLVKADGGEDPIVSIEEQSYFGRVYNIQPDAVSNEGQIVIAQGFLSGSSWYQNDGSDYVNRLILRRSAPASVFE